ncbi:hypothetical protein [Desulfovibrio sp. UCD-KL4C]|uniref:hypothetical protein n=1 Tax=Desulfovibrio sp. UCD-KL4C TaxID=2578120 RepID=UPI0025C43CF4|nr:hypothetical protein [Desulfovibrio sp. UCD-KL4C]
MYPYLDLEKAEKERATKVVQKVLENLSGLNFSEASYVIETARETLHVSRNKADHSMEFKPVSAEIPNSLLAEAL